MGHTNEDGKEKDDELHGGGGKDSIGKNASLKQQENCVD